MPDYNVLVIPDYEYVTHKIIPRLWGIECRFTVKRGDGSFIDDIVMVNPDVDDSGIVLAISDRLNLVDRIEEVPNGE